VTKPRIALVPYSRGWSYDLTAQALVKHLSDRFDFDISYQNRLIGIDGRRSDLVVDFWWKGSLHRRFGRRVLKQVSSHRWHQPKFGALDARKLIAGHLIKCGGVLVPSLRLRAELAEAGLEANVCPKGFHPETFGDFGQRRGDLEIGWAGSAKSSDKNVPMLVAAAPRIRMADQCLTYEEMPDFYNLVDVITCASDAEGDPRPLIEGMACGCFPVVVDVGIVPELVRHGENGLIVERSERAFVDAFAWCRENLDFVREAGRRNAVEMLATRTWSRAASVWSGVFSAAIARARCDPDGVSGRRRVSISRQVPTRPRAVRSQGGRARNRAG
jgi:glycosyltransferase involved in cell wall biosynthesis